MENIEYQIIEDKTKLLRQVGKIGENDIIAMDNGNTILIWFDNEGNKHITKIFLNTAMENKAFIEKIENKAIITKEIGNEIVNNKSEDWQGNENAIITYRLTNIGVTNNARQYPKISAIENYPLISPIKSSISKMERAVYYNNNNTINSIVDYNQYAIGDIVQLYRKTINSEYAFKREFTKQEILTMLLVLYQNTRQIRYKALYDYLYEKLIPETLIAKFRKYNNEINYCTAIQSKRIHERKTIREMISYYNHKIMRLKEIEKYLFNQLKGIQTKENTIVKKIIRKRIRNIQKTIKQLDRYKHEWRARL